jgi:hypothetical protein
VGSIVVVTRAIQKYLHFLAANTKEYKKFNKQLLIGELAGFLAGLLVAEVVNVISRDEWLVSVLSSIADYGAAIIGFFVVYYYDQKPFYLHLDKMARVSKISRMALCLWPSVLVADIVFLLVRPYTQLIMLDMGFEVSVTSTISHFVAFGAFNLAAIISKSLLDYRHSALSESVD